MKRKGFVKLLLFGLVFLSAGCGSKDEKAFSEEYEVKSAGVKSESECVNSEPENIKSGSESANPEPEKTESENDNPEPEDKKPGSEGNTPETEDIKPEPESKKPESEELLDAFLAGEIPAFYNDGTNAYTFMVSDLTFDEVDYFSYSVGERVDLDNDGENEQILEGPYGGIYIDAREGKVYVLAQGEGTAGVLFYTDFENAVWIVHCDTTHVGRQMYWLEKYDGGGNIVDEFVLSAQYWDSPDGKYDENSDFSYRDEKITMAEFEALRKEISGSDT